MLITGYLSGRVFRRPFFREPLSFFWCFASLFLLVSVAVGHDQSYPRAFETESKVDRHERIHSRLCHDRITLDEIRARPGRYLMVTRSSMFERDFDNSLPEGCLCLFSRWPGYLEQPEWQVAASTIENVQGTLVTAHTTGHILANDIPRFVRSIDTRTLIPIHTFEPERFRGISERVQVLHDEARYEV